MKQSAFIVTALMVAAQQVAACPSCVDPKAQNTTAMLVSTIFMSIVPLIFLFSVAYWVYRRDRDAPDDVVVPPAE